MKYYVKISKTIATTKDSSTGNETTTVTEESLNIGMNIDTNTSCSFVDANNDTKNKKYDLLSKVGISYSNITINKQMYSSNMVHLHLLINTNGNGVMATRSMLKNALLDATLDVSLLSGTTTTMAIAAGYKVIDLKYSSVQSNLYLDLIAYSPERYAALNQHSECFTGKTIDEILEMSLNRFNFCKYGTTTQDYRYSTDDTHFLHYYYKANDDKDDTTTRTLHIIPYAVQYNESTYDFLCRLAQRHGEALFFEGEALHFGFQPADDTKIIQIASSNISNIAFEDSTDRGTSLYVGDNYMDCDKAFYYKKDKAPESIKSSIADNTTSQDSADEESTSTSITSSSVNIINQESANNDSFVDLDRDLETISDTNKTNESTYLNSVDNFPVTQESLLTLYDAAFYTRCSIGLLSDLLVNESIIGMAAAAALGLKEATYDAYSNAKAINTDYKADISNSKGTLLAGVRYNDGPRGIDTLKYKRDSSSFISYITERSHDSKQSKITVTLNSSYISDSLQLGSVVMLGDEQDKYYVCSMAISTIATNIFPQITLELIPYLAINDGGVVPIIDPNKMILKSSPQSAIVIDTKDPHQLNRVRVCYKWQFARATNEFKHNETGNILQSDDFKDSFIETLRSMATPWIRMATPSAKGEGGFIFTPDLYSEVIVDYVNGNIDRPYVDSSVFNNNDAPYGAFENDNTSAVSSRHGQKIVFHDGNSGGSIFTRALLPVSDLGLDFLSSFVDVSGGDALAPFDGYTEITDKYNINSVKLSTTDRSVCIKSSLGDVELNALTGIKIKAPNGNIDIMGKNVSIRAGNELSIISGTNVNRPSQVSSTSLAIALAVRDSVGIDLSILRTVVESICKPVGGNMVIKSNRFLCLEAGRGNAKVSRFVKETSDNEKGEPIPIKEPLLAFVKIFDNCKAGIDAIKNAEQTYTEMYNSSSVGYDKIIHDLETYIVDDRISEIKTMLETLESPDDIINSLLTKAHFYSSSSTVFKISSDLNMERMRLSINFGGDLKDQGSTEMVLSLMHLVNNLDNALYAYKRALIDNYDLINSEIDKIGGPLKELLVTRFFKSEVPKLVEFCDYKSENDTTYKIFNQAIQGELAAKRILLLVVIQLMQESNARIDFHAQGNEVIVLNLPAAIETVVNRIFKLDKIIPRISSDSIIVSGRKKHKTKGHEFEIMCQVDVRDADALSPDEIADINVSWRFMANSVLSDEMMSFKEILLSSILGGARKDLPYFYSKGRQIDRQTLQDGSILFSDNRHITARYDSSCGIFVNSDTTFDNELVAKYKEVLSSVDENI